MAQPGGNDPDSERSRNRGKKHEASPDADLQRERTARQSAEHRVRELEEEVARARSAAETAAHLRDQFISMVSHDLRSPIASMLTWAQLLKGGLLPPEKQRQALEAIERGARNQVRLLESLVDLVRLRAHSLRLIEEPTDIFSAARAAIDVLRPFAKERAVALDLRVVGDGPIVDGDTERLQQAIGLLVDNAVRYTPEGGRVEVIVERKGADVVVEVRDSGAGFEPEVARALIDRARNFEVAGEHGRRGLGLPIAYGLLALHHGSLTLSSDGPGRGALARVCLPASTTGAPSA